MLMGPVVVMVVVVLIGNDNDNQSNTKKVFKITADKRTDTRTPFFAIEYFSKIPYTQIMYPE